MLVYREKFVMERLVLKVYQTGEVSVNPFCRYHGSCPDITKILFEKKSEHT